MKNFSGEVLFLDRADINTDEIIPAKYLTELSKEALKPYLLEDLNLDGFDSKKDLAGKEVIISRKNFGCGSSREHAPWALEVNGINLVIAESFARIFRQNMYNGGLLAVELDSSILDELFSLSQQGKIFLKTDLDQKMFTFTGDNFKKEVSFQISDFDNSLVKMGGWLNYADQKY